MKNKLFTIALFLAASLSALGAPVKISVQGTNVVLRWPSQSQQTFVIGYRAALDAANPWTILRTNYPANTSSNETIFVITNVVPVQSFSGGGGGSGGPPPAPNSTSFAGGDTTAGAEAVKRKPFEAPDFIYPPPLQKEPEKWAARSRSAAAAAASNGSGGANALESLTVNSGFYTVSELDEDVDGDLLPTSFDLALGYNPFIRDTDGDSIADGHEDIDGDSFDNAEEVLIGSDPVEPDGGAWTPLPFGGVFWADTTYPVAFSQTNTTGPTGPFFDANGITAESLVTTAPTATTLRMRWNTTFMADAQGFAALENDPIPRLTEAERNILQNAFEPSTKFRDGVVVAISDPSPAKVDAIARETLEKAEQIAANQLRKDFKWIQEVNLGVRQITPQDLPRLMNARIASIHTQFTRLKAATGSLVRRFGRAANRSLPVIGGILIFASGPVYAEQFATAAQDYAHDVINGDPVEGSAAILAGHCNELAPGAGNIVLNYLLP